MQAIDNLATGATFKEVRRTLFKELPFLIPNDSVHANFVDRIKPISSLIKNLTFKNENLKKQRDLLLPKLISGKIDLTQIEQGVA